MKEIKPRFRLIRHTADIGLVAHGDSLSQAFGNAGYGLFSIMADIRRLKETESRVVDVKAGNIEDLLYSWLNDLIFLFDTEGLLLKRFKVRYFSDNHLKATVYGDKYDLARHRIKIGVKAATYHRLEVDREKNRVQVIFDV